MPSNKTIIFSGFAAVVIFIAPAFFDFMPKTASAQTSAPPASAAVIKSFDSIIKINGDSSANVEENITYDFGNNYFRVFGRTLRTVYDVRGINYNLKISGVSAVDESGKDYAAEIYFAKSERRDQIIKIKSSDEPLTGIKTFTLRYRTEGAVGNFKGMPGRFSDYRAFFWKLGFNSIDAENARIKIILPQKFPYDSIRATCTYGSPNTRIPCKGNIDISGSDDSGLIDTVEFEDSLKAGNRFIAYVGFPEVSAKKTAILNRLSTASNAAAAVFAAVFLGALIFLKLAKKKKAPPET